MSNILITGAAGFIGHNVVKKLENLHTITAIDNFTDYGFLPKAECEYLFANRLARITTRVEEMDILGKDMISGMFQFSRPDVVIHLASFPRQKVVNANPQLGAKVMVEGLMNLLEAAEASKVKRFVYISSSMVYGDFEHDVTEDSECSPIGQYGIMKYMGEKLVQDYARRTGMEYVIIRPSAVYGEWDVEDRVVSKFMLGAMKGDTLKVKGAGEVLDFTYVEDAAQGICLAATVEQASNQIYNITRSDPDLYTLKDAAELAIRIAGSGSYEIMDKDADFPSRGRLDITKAQRELGYTPKVDVPQGFALYHKWFTDSYYWQDKLK